MAMDNLKLGKWGEGKAANYLIEKGFQILDKNYRTPYGEIDLVALINSEIVFIEVKTRSSRKFGAPEEAITMKKLQHMVESAENYMQERGELKNDWRIDVIAIEKSKGSVQFKIEHFENISG